MSLFSDSPYMNAAGVHEVFDDKCVTPLNLHKVDHKIEISSNNVSKQTTTMTFINYSGKTLEGELVFPLYIYF